ncbi:MAG: ATP-binding protein [Gemmataceae bacterium]|nr:ATP-binding protein [Gemmataceae bacterium]
MSLKDLCQPRPSVFAKDRRVTVLNLDSFLKGQINGKEFFDENYFTQGMITLVDRAFRHLSGKQAGSSIFQLSQAMGGGKTHSMIALGLLARDPELRKRVLAEKDPAQTLGKCQVVGFNGRHTDAVGGIWGSLADQLGKSEKFADYTKQLKAPGPEAWRQLLGGNPVIIFLDELPPYLEYAAAVSVGASDLAVVSTAALANLFNAVADMDNVVVVLSDLAGTSYSVGQSRLQSAFDRAAQGVSNEARRLAVPITPVNPNGDELYHILRSRLFERIAPEPKIQEVAVAYEKALEEAKSFELTSTQPSSLRQRVLDSYPFHPDFRDLLGKFKENEGFQQTRGVIRLMQMLISDLWNQNKAIQLDLIHPYDIDLNNDEIASEIRTINSSLSEAIAHDISHQGKSEVEQIDSVNGNTDASDAAKLVLLASLSTIPGAIHGLREYQLVDCLQRPGRNLSTFRSNVLDKLATRAWYLHTSADGRLFFKNQQNLAAKLRSTALSLHNEVVDRKLKQRLAEDFAPSMRDCYQVVEVLPPLDGVKVEVEKTTLVIVRPGGQANNLPISSDWQDWWTQQEYKNRVFFLTGSRDTYQKVVDAARHSKALESIQEDLKSQNLGHDDPQWRSLDGLRDRINLQFTAALKEAFDQVIYPSINTALRSAGIELAFAGNNHGESTIRKTLETAQKFTTKIDDPGFISRAEGRLFGPPEAKSVLWSEFKRNAAVHTTWPFHKTSALEELKSQCLQRDHWRAEGSHIRRGPFPPPMPEVNIRELSVDEEGDGFTYLKIEALHATRLVFETGDNDPTLSSSPAPTPARFEAKGLRYRFLAVDPENLTRFSPVKEWTAKIRLKHQLHDRGTHYDLELLALPKVAGMVIRYTTDGSFPNSPTAVTYAGAFKVPANSRLVLAVASFPAFNLSSASSTIPISKRDDKKPKINPDLPARWKKSIKLDDSASVWKFLGKLDQAPLITTNSIKATLESGDNYQTLDYMGAQTFNGALLKETMEKLQALIGGGAVRMTVGGLAFPTGQDLLDWLKAAEIPFDLNSVEQ